MPIPFEVDSYPELLGNPRSIADFTSIIRRKIIFHDSQSREYVLVKNIGYNLQYLEFLLRLSNIDRWHSVLETENIKTIIITSSSILEAILYHVVMINRLNISTKKLVPQSRKSIASNHIREGLTMEILYRETVPEYEEDLSFDSLIKKTEKYHLLGADHDIYADIKKLQKLRNKVHIHIGTNNYDTDYNSFGRAQLTSCKEALYKVLTFYFNTSGEDIFDFLLDY